MEKDGFKVKLHIYDLHPAHARQLSMVFLRKVIEAAVWHTSLVVHGKEYYFSGGIRQDLAGRTAYGTPVKILELGATNVLKDVFESHLQEISPRFTLETYNLLTHNCNNFCNEVAQFLVGAAIPDYILQLPDEVMKSPLGAQILPMLERLETTLKFGAVPQSAATTTTKSVESKTSTKTSEKGNADLASSYNHHRFSVPMIQRLETTFEPGSVPRRFYPVSAPASAVPRINPFGVVVPTHPYIAPVSPFSSFKPTFLHAGAERKTPLFAPVSPFNPPTGAVPKMLPFPPMFFPPSAPAGRVKRVATSTMTCEKDSAVSASAKSVKQPEVSDPLGEARSRVKDEITKEFAAIMATGTLSANEAAALAVRRVRERYGRSNASVQ